MRSISFIELENLAEELNTQFRGCQLQEVRTNDRYLALGFYRQGKVHWLMVDLNPQCPLIFLSEGHCPIIKSAQQKPVGLFLKSHGVGLRLHQVFVQRKWGRVLEVILQAQGEGRERAPESTLNDLQKDHQNVPLESSATSLLLQVIPKLVNVTVISAKKKIHWNKPTLLKELPTAVSSVSIEEKDPVRSLSQIMAEWRQHSSQKDGSGKLMPGNSLGTPEELWEKQRQKNLQKKRKALIQIEAGLAEEKELYWYELGETLKAQGDLQIEERFRKDLDLKKSFSENMEIVFSKARQFKNKKAGTLERLLILKKEIADLERSVFNPKQVNTPRGVVERDLFANTEAQGRKKVLPSGLVAYLGKTGKDNLQLLRSAKAWDYWMHLRDYPGAHLILRRQRGQNITEVEFQEVARWLLRETLKNSKDSHGIKFDVLIVEARFVRPIKGDKLGRVQYSSERIIKVLFI